MGYLPAQLVPVFPLPGVVLFPHAEMGLHVFEVRYRTLVRDALQGQRQLALATLAPGWEGEYEGSPAFHDLACVASFEEVVWLPNDCYQLRIRGQARVRLGRAVREFPYRACLSDAVPDMPYTEDDPLAQVARQGLLEERTRLAPLATEAWLAPPTLEDDATLAAVSGVLATQARLPGEVKLALLAEDDVVERARLLREHLRGLGPGSPRAQGLTRN
jgi:hypothetical protein